MALLPYSKPHASSADWVLHLQGCGLMVPRPKFAQAQLERIGYHRLRIYLDSRRQLHLPDKPFVPGTSFNDVLGIYRFDAQLRSLCFDAVGSFEVMFRNSIAEALSVRHGSHPWFDPAAFQDPARRRDAIGTLSSIYARSRDERARHYMITYREVLPPVWTLKEFLSFGQAERFFEQLCGPVQNQVAREFGLPTVPAFQSWTKALVDLRNICAHHDRLFNRSMQKQPQRLRHANVPVAPSNKPKAIFECLDWMLRSRGAKAGLTARVGRLLSRYPMIRLAELGY